MSGSRIPHAGLQPARQAMKMGQVAPFCYPRFSFPSFPTFLIGNPGVFAFLSNCEDKRPWILAFARMTDESYFHAKSAEKELRGTSKKNLKQIFSRIRAF